MKWLIGIGGVLLVALVLVLGNCAGKQLTTPEKNAAYEVTDSTGHLIRLAQKPQRVVSLSLGTDEILLGLLPPERIAAVTYLAADPGISSSAEEAKAVAVKIRDNTEAVIGLQPDLVLIADWMKPELSQTLRDAGLNVYVYKTPYSINEIKSVINELALVLGEGAKGREIVAAMDQTLNAVSLAIKTIPPERRQKVIALSFMGAFGCKGSLFDDMCSNAGVINGAAEAGLEKNMTLSKEQIVKADPDFLLLPNWNYDGKKDIEGFRKSVQNDPALQTVKAVREKRLLEIPDCHLYCVSQHAAEGIKEIALLAYPEAFAGKAK